MIDPEKDGYCEWCQGDLLIGMVFFHCDWCGAEFCSQDCHEMVHTEGDTQ